MYFLFINFQVLNCIRYWGAASMDAHTENELSIFKNLL